jgi:hypothetical protein
MPKSPSASARLGIGRASACVLLGLLTPCVPVSVAQIGPVLAPPKQTERDRPEEEYRRRLEEEDRRIEAYASSDWGRLGTLKCRVALPEKTSAAELFRGRVEFVWEAGELPKGVSQILRRDISDTGTLLLQNEKGGDVAGAIRVEAEDPWSGMPPGNFDDAAALDPASPGNWSWKPRWRMARAGVAPGKYTARVELSLQPPFDENGNSPPPVLLVSEPVPIEVTPAVLEKVTIVVPKGRAIPGGRFIFEGETEEITVEVTKGFLTGVASASTLQSGLPTKEKRGRYSGVLTPPLFKGSVDAIGPDAPTYDVVVFESCETSMHLWTPQNCGYRLLWSKRFVTGEQKPQPAPSPPGRP